MEDDFGYSLQVCDLLERLRVNAVNMNNYHRSRFFHFKSYNKWFRLPIIILSIVSGACAVGLQSLEVEQKIISITTCVISLIIAMLSAVELHLSISDKLEESYKKSKQYYLLATDIYRCLKLNPSERSERGGDYLGRIFTTYSELQKSSELMKKTMKNDCLMRIPHELVEFKSIPDSNTPVQSLDDQQVIYSNIPHSNSHIFKPQGSPNLAKEYFEMPDEIVEEEDKDVESNLSK